MKFEKNFFLIVIFVTFISGCSSIKDTLTGVKKQNTDEFLVKKKDPLVLPPNFNDLPKPQTQKNSENNEEESIDFTNILFFDIPSIYYISSFYETVFKFKWSIKLIIFFSFLLPLTLIFIWNKVIKTNERRRTTTLVLLTIILSTIIFINDLNSNAFAFLLFPVIIIFTSYMEQSKITIVTNLVLSISIIAPYVLILFSLLLIN